MQVFVWKLVLGRLFLSVLHTHVCFFFVSSDAVSLLFADVQQRYAWVVSGHY